MLGDGLLVASDRQHVTAVGGVGERRFERGAHATRSHLQQLRSGNVARQRRHSTSPSSSTSWSGSSQHGQRSSPKPTSRYCAGGSGSLSPSSPLRALGRVVRRCGRRRRERGNRLDCAATNGCRRSYVVASARQLCGRPTRGSPRGRPAMPSCAGIRMWASRNWARTSAGFGFGDRASSRYRSFIRAVSESCMRLPSSRPQPPQLGSAASHTARAGRIQKPPPDPQPAQLVRSVLAYDRRLGLDFTTAWDDALDPSAVSTACTPASASAGRRP